MIRLKMLAAAVTLSLGLVPDTSAVTRANDTNPVADRGSEFHGRYTVYFRTCDHGAGQKHGCFDCFCDARRAADSLARSGFQVSIR